VRPKLRSAIWGKEHETRRGQEPEGGTMDTGGMDPQAVLDFYQTLLLGH
jgi:hypothetical protein